jgi:flavin-dependent dehydrogenase
MKGVRFAEAVVIGAGPAGLGASIGLARHGIGVSVLEQQEILGAERRGETIRFNQDMEEILGRGFFDRIALRRIDKRRYYSHSGKRYVDRKISNPNIIFNWTDMIAVMAEIADKSGVRVRTGCRVTRLVEQRAGKVESVITEADGAQEEIAAGVVISCGGHDDPASRHVGLQRSSIDMAASKMLVRGYQGPDDRLEYHFHAGQKGLVVAAIFPREEKEAELILLDTSGSGEALSFDEFSKAHHIFGERVKGSEPFYKLDTRIPMGGMLYPFSPRPGLVMAGDALGHVQARGGSGIRTSFLIGYAAGALVSKALYSGDLKEKNQREFEKSMAKNRHVKSLERHNLVFLHLRSRIFGCVRSPEHMDRLWPLLKVALR